MYTFPICFLDIDGCLNSYEQAAKMGGYPHSFRPEYMVKFDHGCIKRVRSLGVKIVVSSTWRRQFTAEQFKVALDLDVIGCTPVLNLPRGQEINEWRTNNEHVGPYCILDDDCDMLPGQPFIQINGNVGIQDTDIVRARSHLGILYTL